jgi:radical SAM superfamily enzyme YgiQ (UPF0313 family)
MLDRATAIRDEVYLTGRPGGSGRLRVALLFPAEYHVGMANLAVHALYRLFNNQPEVICERVFYPQLPGSSSTTLRSLESGAPLGGFDAVAISSSYELDWLRIPAALRQGGAPPLARDRSAQAPLVIIGGPAVTANPEPLAELSDAMFIGEVEGAVPAIADALMSPDRDEARAGLAGIPGMYVPTLAPGGPAARAPAPDLDRHQTHSQILTPHSAFPNTFLLETGRGCPRSCTFCLARSIYAPFRTRDFDGLLRAAELGLEFTDRVGLVGAAVGDYRRIAELVAAITERGGRVSLSSLRIERVTDELLAPLVAGGRRSITLAPEAADEQVAATLGKRIGRQALLDAVACADRAGIGAVKLYYIVGVPGETDEQALRIADEIVELERAFPRLRFTVSVGPLIPKPHTELADAQAPAPSVVKARLRKLGAALRRDTHARVQLGSARWGAVQTVLSRGGRELTPLLLESENASAGEFLSALRDAGLSLDRYLGGASDG